MKVIISCCTGLGNLYLKGKMLEILFKNFSEEIILLMDERWGYYDLLKKDKRKFKFHLTDTSFSLRKLFKYLKYINSVKVNKIIFPFDSSPSWIVLTSSLLFNGEIIMHYFDKFSLKYFIYLLLVRIFRAGRKCSFIKVRKSVHEEDLNIDLIKNFIKNLDLNYLMKSKRGLDIFTNSGNKHKSIIIQSSARNGFDTPKIWGANNFRLIIDYISNNYPNYEIIMVGDNNEFDYINKIIKGSKAINLSGKILLIELVKLINEAELVICHDSSVMHIADSQNIPTIPLLGPTDLSRTGPKSFNTFPLVSVNESTMYMYNFCENEDSTLSRFKADFCMKNIKVDMVKSFIDLVLQRK